MLKELHPPRRLGGAAAPVSMPFLARMPRVLINVVMLGAVVAWLLPLLGLVVNAFRPFTNASSSGWWTVFTHPAFTLDNFRTALASSNLVSGLMNSLLITIPSTILVVAVGSCAAFALIWTDLPGRKWIFAFIVALLVVPPEVTLYPTLVILKAVHLVNTFPGIWLSHASAVTPFAVYLMGSFFAQIPVELIEAAKVDGAKVHQQLLQIVLPLSWSAMASLATLDFLWVWNDLLRALVIIPDPTIRPLTAALSSMAGGYGEYITVVAAGATMLMVPPLIIFLVGQRAFIQGVLAGAVKA
jgi:alpha-glucoside transport system permease protein